MVVHVLGGAAGGYLEHITGQGRGILLDGSGMVANDAPEGGGSAVEAPVLDQLGGPGAKGDAEVVDQEFPAVEQAEDELIPRGRVAAGGARVAPCPAVTDRLPGGLAALVAGCPGSTAGIVGVRIHQFQTAAAAIGPLAPAAAVGVVQLVSDIVIGIAQGDGFATAGQTAAPGSQRRGSRMQRGERGGIPGHHQITARRDAGGGREIEPDAVTELPAAEIHRGGAFVIQFDPLLTAIAHRVVEDFVDDNVSADNGHIGGSGGGRGGVAPASLIDQTTQAVGDRPGIA